MLATSMNRPLSQTTSN